jgi:putative membrane protein
MSTFRTLRTTPLAAALLVGCTLMAGCHRDENAENAPPAASTAMPPAEATTGMPAASTTAMTNPAAMPPASATAMPPAAATTAGAMPAAGPITDTSFYEQALAAGDKEIAAAKLAEKNGSAKVKDYAKMLVTDHTAMGAKVKAAAGKDVTAPTTPPDTSALDGKTGKDFDTAFLDQMVTDHQNAVALFDNASKNASTDKAKKLASDALPKLQKHLDEAQKLQTSM